MSIELTRAERLELAIARISREFKSAGTDLDGELSTGLAIALGTGDVEFAESLAESLAD